MTHGGSRVRHRNRKMISPDMEQTNESARRCMRRMLEEIETGTRGRERMGAVEKWRFEGERVDHGGCSSQPAYDADD